MTQNTHWLEQDPSSSPHTPRGGRPASPVPGELGPAGGSWLLRPRCCGSRRHTTSASRPGGEEKGGGTEPAPPQGLTRQAASITLVRTQPRPVHGTLGNAVGGRRPAAPREFCHWGGKGPRPGAGVGEQGGFRGAPRPADGAFSPCPRVVESLQVLCSPPRKPLICWTRAQSYDCVWP